MAILHECNPSTELRTDTAQSMHGDVHVVEAELVEPGITHSAPYTSHELAGLLRIGESTLRTRWLPWLQKVAPIELLVTDAGYTDLARSLAQEFSELPKKKTDRERWVSTAKERYSREFLPNGVTPEGVSDELGGALALLRNQGSDLQTAADDQFQQLQQLIESQAQVEAEFDDAEIAAMKATGMKRGVMRFKIESEAEDTAYYGLRKARSQTRNPKPGKS